MKEKEKELYFCLFKLEIACTLEIKMMMVQATIN